MRAYFIILSGLLLVAIFVSYKIVTAPQFDRSTHETSPRSKLASNDNGTSDCFEKRYAPQIQECGGLLKYSPPPVHYTSTKDRNTR